MNCDRERLSHYLDGELSSDEIQDLKRHLEACNRCATDLAVYRKVDESLRGLKKASPRGELRRMVYSKIEERRRSRPRRVRAAAAVPLAACVLVAGTLGAWSLGRLSSMGPPVVTAAFVVQEAPDSLDGMRLELVFDRAVAPDSLAHAISIEPPLALLQRVRENKVELIPQVPPPPGSSYRLVVHDVRDQGGRVQTEPIILSLTAGPIATLVQESPGTPGARSETPPLTTLPSNPMAAPSGTGLTVLEVNPQIQLQLGTARGPEQAVQLSEQAFQGGAMLIRSDSKQIMVLVRPSSRWVSFPNTWRPGEVLTSAGVRPPGTFEPLRGFGKLWRDQPAVKLQLGWPVYEERNAAGAAQTFENGALVRSSFGVIYVLFNNGTWRSLPDPRQ
jgi:hypothetical protein